MTPLEKLRALALAKKAGQGNPSSDHQEPVKEITGSAKEDETSSASGMVQNESQKQKEIQVSPEVQAPDIEGQSELPEVDSEGEESSNLPVPSNQNNSSDSSKSSDHPLKMALAELESALLGKLPEFRTILRDIHSKLRSDPDCVTALSEDEIGVIVQGLIHHANVEVIAPKAAKSAKKASKTPVSASDL